VDEFKSFSESQSYISTSPGTFRLFKALSLAWGTERMLRVHSYGSLLFVFLGVILQFDSLRWSILTLGIVLLLCTELVNTTVERLADLGAQNRFCPLVREAKDIAAGAVLCVAFGAILMALLLCFSTPTMQSLLH
jgi:diacylglycerol kinase